MKVLQVDESRYFKSMNLCLFVMSVRCCFEVGATLLGTCPKKNLYICLSRSLENGDLKCHQWYLILSKARHSSVASANKCHIVCSLMAVSLSKDAKKIPKLREVSR